ncbi:hypothetical protein B0H13DRAFT_1975184 [Mycena leptocephala]|nr:hypothetical protein B0H13DRAFT_1975184 [Mycena leptocephala]
MFDSELYEDMNSVMLENEDADSETHDDDVPPTHEVPKDEAAAAQEEVPPVQEKAPAPTGPRDAGPPFDDDDADMILRSSDLVDFRVHKLFLVKASLVFRDMISLHARGPLSSSSSSPNVTYPDALSPTGLPIVPLPDEPAPAVDMLLRFCYIPLIPTPSTLSDIELALHLGSKFLMPHILSAAKSSILAQMESGVLPANRVFALGWLHRQRDIVLAAASHPSREPLLAGPPYPEYELIPALVLHKLFAFRHQARTLAATSAPCGDFSWITRPHIELFIEVYPDEPAPRCKCPATRFHEPEADFPGFPTQAELGAERGLVDWFWAFLRAGLAKMAKATVQEAMDVVKDPALAAPGIEAAHGCTVCETRAGPALADFGVAWARVIDDRRQLTIQTPF